MADMNQYRYVIFIIAINLILGIALAVYYDPNTFDYGVLEETNNLGEYVANNTERQQSEQVSSDVQEEASAGNMLDMSLTIMRLMFTGLNPFNRPDSGDDYQQLSDLVWYGLWLFRVLTYAITMIMLWKLIKGK